jgi:hypothetical protein
MPAPPATAPNRPGKAEPGTEFAPAAALVVAGLEQPAEPRQAGATATAGGDAQDAGRKLVTRGRQMLAYTAGHWLAGPDSSMV